MWLLHYVGLTTIFAILTFAYYAVMRSIIILPFLIIGATWAMFKFIDESNKANWMQRITIIEVIFQIVMLCALLVVIGVLQVWKPWFEFWHNPVTLVVFIFSSSWAMSFSQGYVPLLRSGAMFCRISSIIVVVAIFASALFPANCDYTATKWASICAASLLNVASLWALWAVPKQIYSFISLDKRHDELGRQLSRLQHIANVLPDSVDLNSRHSS